MSNEYYDTNISTSVRLGVGGKLYRIRTHKQVPYITYKRKTRVLFKGPISGAFINVGGSRVYFV